MLNKSENTKYSPFQKSFLLISNLLLSFIPPTTRVVIENCAITTKRRNSSHRLPLLEREGTTQSQISRYQRYYFIISRCITGSAVEIHPFIIRAPPSLLLLSSCTKRKQLHSASLSHLTWTKTSMGASEPLVESGSPGTPNFMARILAACGYSKASKRIARKSSRTVDCTPECPA